MEARDAVKLAKQHVREIFDEEDISQVGLEEMEFDEHSKTWKITIGFRRPWRRPVEKKVSATSLYGSFNSDQYLDRWYKQVIFDNESGSLISIKDRDLVAAA